MIAKKLMNRNGTPTSLMDVWINAWKWMQDEGGIELIKGSLADRKVNHNEGYQFVPCFKGRSPKDMAYYITQHFEGRSDNPPDHLKQIVRDYQIKMMKIWGWPEWGYSAVKHLQPSESK